MTVAITSKCCTRCGSVKPLSDFPLRIDYGKDKRRSQCRSCRSMRDKRYRKLARRSCEVAECEYLGYLVRKMCPMHYRRWWKYGDPLVSFPRQRRLCSVQECRRPHYGHGLCGMHYQRMRNHGQLGGPQSERRPRPKVCLVKGCHRPHDARGLCNLHYCRWLHSGSLGGPNPRLPRGRCEVNGCRRPHHARGLCCTHYQWFRRRGITVTIPT